MMFLKKKNCRAAKNTLTLSLDEAKIPGVVRIDLSTLPFTHFHVRSGNEGSVLGYNDATGQFTALALFADRGAADKALHKVEKALLRPSCEITGGIVRAVIIVLGVFLLFSVLGRVVGMMMPQQEPNFAAHMEAPLEEPVAPTAGEPMDAESKLGGQP